MSAKAKVLIIDDNPEFIENTRSVLLSNGDFEVISAFDGIEGLEKVKSEAPDIIILDVMMPNKDGYELCAELKHDKNYSHIPIILLTSASSHVPDVQYNPRMGMETEADDYIDKPVEPHRILESVNNLLGIN